MRSALLLAPGQLEMRQTEIPHPGPGEVVIRIEMTLTCGTDLKTYRRGHAKFPFPFPLGHEYTGIVTAVGTGVENFKIGEAVLGVQSAPCLECRQCRRGFYNLCDTIVERMAWGAFADYYCVPALVVQQNLYHRPPGMSAQRAAFLEPLACVVAGQANVPFQPDDTVVIMGCGTIGLLHVMLAKKRGAKRIIVSGRHPERLALAGTLGADLLIDVDKESTVDRVREITGGFGAELVIECVGRPQAWEEAQWLACQGGFVLLFGGCPSKTTASFDTLRLHYDQLTIKGVFHFNPADVRQAYEYLCQDGLPVEAIITGTHSLDELPEIIQKLDRGEGIKYAIHP